MSLKFNNTEITSTIFKDAAHPNGVTLCKLIYNGTLAWEKHAYGSWTTTTAASCTTAGSKKRTCTRTDCGCSETETIFALGHKWSDASYMWDTSTANPSCTASRSCSNATHEGNKFESAAGTVTSNITNATCTTTGLKAYTAKFAVPWAVQQYKEETIAKLAHTQVTDTAVAATCTTAGKTEGKHCSVCNTVITAQTTIPALGHSWKTAEYQWSGFASCEATRRCNRDTSHKETSTTTNITSKVTTAATCTATGVRTYTATFPSSASWAGTSTTTEILSKIDHTYTVTYSWNGYTACTATRKCNSCGHSESVSAARITNDGASETCTQSAVRTYTATFNSSWASISQKTEVRAALGHSYSPAGSAWNDVTECIATGLCVHDQMHTTTQKGTITSKVTTPATCTTPGTKTYTATFSKPLGWTKAPDTATKQVQIAAKGHDWNDLFIYTWAADLSTCTAQRTCKNDSTHVDTAYGVVSSKVTTAATCTKAGVRTYTATFAALSNGVTPKTQTKTQSIPATGVHTAGDWQITVQPTITSTGTKVKKCTSCGTVMEEATIPKLDIKAPTIAATVELGLKTGSITYDKITVTLTNPNSMALDYTINYSLTSGVSSRVFANNNSGTIAANSSATHIVTPMETDLQYGGNKESTFGNCRIFAFFDDYPSVNATKDVTGSTPEREESSTTVEIPEVGTYSLLDDNTQLEVFAIELFESDSLSGYYGDEIVAGGYLENNEGTVVPVLYKTDVNNYAAADVDLEDAFFYVGTAKLGNATVDKWRKIELGGGDFSWNSYAQGYIYTTAIVENNRFMDGILEE